MRYRSRGRVPDYVLAGASKGLSASMLPTYVPLSLGCAVHCLDRSVCRSGSSGLKARSPPSALQSRAWLFTSRARKVIKDKLGLQDMPSN